MTLISKLSIKEYHRDLKVWRGSNSVEGYIEIVNLYCEAKIEHELGQIGDLHNGQV